MPYNETTKARRYFINLWNDMCQKVQFHEKWKHFHFFESWLPGCRWYVLDLTLIFLSQSQSELTITALLFQQLSPDNKNKSLLYTHALVKNHSINLWRASGIPLRYALWNPNFIIKWYMSISLYMVIVGISNYHMTVVSLVRNCEEKIYAELRDEL